MSHPNNPPPAPIVKDDQTVPETFQPDQAALPASGHRFEEAHA
jgi:hypothetical protein